MNMFCSRRNQVYPIVWAGEAAVEKHFSRLEDWRREEELYARLSGRIPLPKVLAGCAGSLVLQYQQGSTLLEELERQEQAGFQPEPWMALAQWLKAYHGLCRQVPGDMHLRNFIWDGEKKTVTGLDLESSEDAPLTVRGAMLPAMVLEYRPAHTAVKRQAAMLLASLLHLSLPQIQAARREILARRGTHRKESMSGIILAGGKSVRMGTDKALVHLAGNTLLELQMRRLRQLGIADIIISGENAPPALGTRVIGDEIPHQGPLGGIHACLKAARYSHCLVLSVDTPLIPGSALQQLCRSCTKGIAVLCHGGREEPLVGVYPKGAAPVAEALLANHRLQVRTLGDTVGRTCWEYKGPEELLQNCNTPQQIQEVKKTIALYCDAGFPMRAWLNSGRF